MLNAATFGNYRLLEKIGGGSLGEVYRASLLDDADRPQVALKRLLTGKLGHPDFTAVFAKEVMISQKMRHPLLLGAIDHGDVSNWPFLISKLAKEGSLQERLRATKAMTPDALRQLTSDLAQALDAMHVLGYTHCDLNPGNVVFDEGRAHLIDFSAATPLGQSQPHPLGSYPYMCPEQVRGQALDQRSDVFTMATLLWECATGVRPFWRPAPHLCFMAVVESDPPPLPEPLSALEAALRPALAKAPSERTPSVNALAQAVLAAL